jgi:N-acetylneuraminate lyase
MTSHPVEILTAAFTPMHPDGSINYDRIPGLYYHYVKSGVQGIFLNGTTGECMSLTTEERQKLVEAWAACRTQNNNPGFRIFVHAGSCSLYETAQMAEHAQAYGADGIAMVATFYFRPQTLEDLIEQCAYVAAAAPETPFYYYNIPSMTGVNFPLTRIIEMASGRIPNFAGLKNSFNDLVDYQECIHYTKQNLAMYWGTDEIFMMLYAAGNRHYVGSTYNYMSGIYFKMVEAYHAGDHEKTISLQREASSIYKVLLSNNGLIAGKEAMRYIGIDCGPVRRPLKALSTAASDTMLSNLQRTTFFDHASVREKRMETLL